MAPAVMRDPYRSLERIARRYGDVARVPLPGFDLILLSHPDHVQHVMSANHVNYQKPLMVREVLFDGPPRFSAMADGQEWRSVRRMLNPKFTDRGLAPLSDLMLDTIATTVESWHEFSQADEPVDMQHEFVLLTMAVMLRSMFTMPAERLLTVRLVHDFSAVLRGMAVRLFFNGNLPARVPRPFARSFNAAIESIFHFIDAMVAERRRNPIPDGDLLSMVLGARFDDGSLMSDEHVRRELLGLIIGGYETTAAVLAWVLARLPFAPEAQERAYAEVDALDGPLEHADLERLRWLRACFDEAQRLQGFPLNPREAIEDDEIGGYRIPRGSTVGVSGWTLHRDPRFWRAPERFDPSRFLDQEINKYAFLPFGVGARRCLGVRMGYMVGLYTLATAFRHYRFVPPAGWAPQPRFTFANVVRGGVPMKVIGR